MKQFCSLIFLLACALSAWGQQHYIALKGLVVNDRNQAVAAVTVRVKGNQQLVLTNDKGVFQFDHIDKDAVLEISCVGYESQEVGVKNRDFLRIRLQQKASLLDEAVVIAYGKTTRRFNTGAVSSVGAETISRQPVSNPLAALEGQVPGLVVTQSSGVPGASIKVQLRGQNSLLQGSSPLFVIDGVPYAPGNDAFNQLSSAATPTADLGLSPFNLVNPDDIESISILKDADATAIYGSRGANGVILITTKRGKAGKTKVDLKVYSGYSRVAHHLDLLDTKAYLNMRHEAYANDNTSPDIYSAPDLLVWDTTSYTDFQKLFTGGSAHYTDAQLSLSGGSGQTTFLLSGNYHRQGTVFPGKQYDSRASAHYNLSHYSKDQRFHLQFSSLFSLDDNHLSSANPMNILLPPDYPSLKDSSGHYRWTYGGQDLENPLAYLLADYEAKTANLVSNLNMSYRLLKHLSLKLNVGYNFLKADEVSTHPIGSQDPAYQPQGYSQFGNNSFNSWIVEPQADYNTLIGGGKLEVLAGGSFQQKTNRYASFFAYGYSNDELLKSMDAAADFSVSDDGQSMYRYAAFFGRLNYNWRGKYILTLSGRRDGSSRFGPGKRIAGFGAAGAAWIFSEEPFVSQALPFLSFGKLRGSYGSSGNDQIGDYQYLDSWKSTNNAYAGSSGLQPSRLYNPDYSWEVNRKLEAAIELGLWHNRLMLDVDYYRNRSSNQLVAYTLPTQTGFSNVLENLPAHLQNSGWELSLHAQEMSGSFDWSTEVNITFARNKLLAFPNLAKSSYAHRYAIGKSSNAISGYELVGVDSQSGIYQFKDVNNDGSINSDDYVIDGSTDPDFYGGLSNTFSYKGFELNLFVSFRKQQGSLPLAALSYSAPGRMNNLPLYIYQQRWQSLGDQARIQKLTTSYSSAASAASNKLATSHAIYGDASYIRIKNVGLSYNLPGGWLARTGINNVRVFLQGRNLWTITNYKGLDPESQNLYTLPPLRSLSAGIHFSF